jgi:hypothetical protein
MKKPMKILFAIFCIFAVVLFSPVGPARQAAADDAHSAPVLKPGDKGTAIFGDEYRFLPPPSPWEFIKGGEGSDFVLGYYRKDPGKLQLESTFFAFSEEPYGYSRDMNQRAEEFLKRFFWSSHVKMKVVERKKVNVLGGEGLALLLEGKDPVKGVKVRSRVIFGKRGDRVVAFYINQWRNIDGSFDQSAFDTFDRFAGSFEFIKKSFYETL